jgi:hypothetical protein
VWGARERQRAHDIHGQTLSTQQGWVVDGVIPSFEILQWRTLECVSSVTCTLRRLSWPSVLTNVSVALRDRRWSSFGSRPSASGATAISVSRFLASAGATSSKSRPGVFLHGRPNVGSKDVEPSAQKLALISAGECPSACTWIRVGLGFELELGPKGHAST